MPNIQPIFLIYSDIIKRYTSIEAEPLGLILYGNKAHTLLRSLKFCMRMSQYSVAKRNRPQMYLQQYLKQRCLFNNENKFIIIKYREI